ncbi:MAG: GFA family protein [Pseudomonadota bacterium]
MGELHWGHCRCGGVTFEVELPVSRGVTCRCDSCRLSRTAPMTAMIGVDNGQSRWTGQEPDTYRSSPGMTQRSCTPPSFRGRRMTGRIPFYPALPEGPDAFLRESHSVLEENLTGVISPTACPQIRIV